MPDLDRVAVLLDGEALARWEADALDRMVERTGVEVSRLVVDRREDDRGLRGTVERLTELREWAPVAAAITAGPTPRYAETVRVGEVDALADAERTYCVPQPRDDFGNELPDHAVDDLRGTDLAIRSGFGILLGEALRAPTHGALSFHHGDLERYRGQPAGFWEYVHGESEGAITVQRITEELDAGQVVASEPVDIEDAATWGEVRRRLYEGSEDLLARAVENVRDPDSEPYEPDELGELYSMPEGRPVLTYLRKTAAGYLRASTGGAARRAGN